LRIDTEHTRLLHQLSTSSPQVRYLAAHDDDPLPIPTSSPRSKPQTTLTAHTPKRVPILAGGDSSTTSSARTVTKRYASASASSSTVRADKLLHPSPTKPALAFPRVVRRVQAVIAVPVKQEEEGDENRVDWPTDSAVQQQPPSTPTGTTSGAGTSSRGGRGSARRRKSSASSHQRSLAAPPPSNDGRRRSFAAHDDEEGGGEGDEEESPSDEDEDEEVDDGGEYVDEEEVEIAIASGTPATTGPRTMMVPWGRKHIGHEPDEEDDELMMYPKVGPFPSFPPVASCFSWVNAVGIFFFHRIWILLRESVPHTRTTTSPHVFHAARVSSTSRHSSSNSSVYQRAPTPPLCRNGKRRRRDLGVRRVQSGESDDNDDDDFPHHISFYLRFLY
jgi:hypothetical protein